MIDGRDISFRGFENGCFVGATVFDHVTSSMSIYTDEIFGPVLCVVRVDSYDSALQLVNDHEYGNGAAILPETAMREGFFASGPYRNGRHQCADPRSHGFS
ncbi:MAG: hypothetical protein CM1200mP41_07230 [Gammaproteobacteria bacterium]|nr:MAG: hypothetical protein CM1200mP41_07230 [Gammaproteobacteria bacterium]